MRGNGTERHRSQGHTPNFQKSKTKGQGSEKGKMVSLENGYYFDYRAFNPGFGFGPELRIKSMKSRIILVMR